MRRAHADALIESNICILNLWGETMPSWVAEDFASDRAFVITGNAGSEMGTWLRVADATGDDIADIYTNDGDQTTVIDLSRSLAEPATTTGDDATGGIHGYYSVGGGGWSCALNTNNENAANPWRMMFSFVFGMVGLAVFLRRRLKS